MTLTEQEVYQLVFNRHLSDNLLKDAQIAAAQTRWIDAYIPVKFLNDIASDEEFIDKYLKPVWAWGTLYSNFNYIATNITDKGVIQMLVEGTATVMGNDMLLNTKNEILNNVLTLLKRLDNYAKLQNELGTAGYENYTGLLIEPMSIQFFGRARFNQTPY